MHGMLRRSPTEYRLQRLVMGIGLALGAVNAGASGVGDPTTAPNPVVGSQPWQPQNSPMQLARRQLHARRLVRPSSAPRVLSALNCADDNSSGSLRALVAAASNGDTIDLTQLGCSTITLTQGAIAVQIDDLTLLGPGAGQLTIDGNAQDRVIADYGYGTLALQGLTISNGNHTVTGLHVALGACVATGSYLALIDSVVTHCHAEGEGAYGGGVFGYNLSMRNSTISDSVALGSNPDTGTAAFGGGAFVYTFDLESSTISGNSAVRQFSPDHGGYEIGGALVSVHGGTLYGSTIDSNTSYQLGGGIASFGPLFLSNSTVSGNHAQHGVGGGLHLRALADLALYNTTVTDNSAALGGGGILLSPGPRALNLNSSIVSGNSTASNGGGDIFASYANPVDGGNNLIGTVTPVLTLPPDTVRAPARLLPLAFNGGPTRTHAMSAGSPAIDAGSNLLGLGQDQRGGGFARLFGAAVDIGAYEAQQVLVAAPGVPIPASSRTALAVLVVMLGWFGWRRRGSAQF